MENYEKNKNDFILEVMRELEAEMRQKEKVKKENTFLPEEIARQPVPKEILNQGDLWRRHQALIEADADAWEVSARDTFLSKAKSGGLSPLLVLIGEYLFYASDNETGRRRLIEILFLQDASQRLKIHNFQVLEAASEGTPMVHASQVEHLAYPLFPFSGPDLKQLNVSILTQTEQQMCEGGSAADSTISKMSLPENQVIRGGAIPFPVVDNNGNQTGYHVDMQSVHDAATALERSIEMRDGREHTHMSRMKRLLGDAVRSSNRPQGGYFPPRYARNDNWRLQGEVTRRNPYAGERFRGGMAPEEPKNGYSPS